jgi:hypothetical protein
VIYVDMTERYDFQAGEYRCEDVMRRKIAFPLKSVRFVCNAYANISKGDVYEVEFESLEDELVFLLKENFGLVDKLVVERYKNARQDLRG